MPSIYNLIIYNLFKIYQNGKTKITLMPFGRNSAQC